MKFFSDVLKYFVSITTGVILIFIIIMLVNGDTGMYLSTLIEIPSLALLTAVITAVIHRGEPEQKQFIKRMIVHFVLISVVVSAAGVIFGWVNLSFGGIMIMLVCNTAVYAFTYSMTYIFSKKEADELNEALMRKRTQQ